MKKKVLFILFLFVIDICCVLYLTSIKLNDPYVFANNHKPILIQHYDLELDNTDNFVFSNYYVVLSINPYSISYHFKDDYLFITVITDYNEYDFKYKYHIKEPKIIEKEVIKEIYVDKYIEHNNDDTEDILNNVINTDEIIFEGYHDMTFAVDTDISTIINELTKDIITNVQVSIDYSSLNTSAEGCYPVYYYYSDMSKSVNICIE